MGKRTNTAVWMEKYNRWQIKVQKDNERKTFYSSKPGRAGLRECNKKADAWLDDNIKDTSKRCNYWLDKYVERAKLATSKSNWRAVENHVEKYIRPRIGNKKFSQLTENSFQSILDKAYANSDPKLSKKTLENIRATIKSFVKFCRKEKVTTMHLEDLTIAAAARTKEKEILQPDDLLTLFKVNTTQLKGKIVFDDYIHAYRFQVLTGLRPGELRGLKRSDISGKTISLKRARNSFNEITTGKNENALRTFTLSDMAYIELQHQLKLFPDSEYIFPFSQPNYLKRWNRYCETNGMNIISTYEMRHTFVSIAKHLPEGMVKQLVGHSADMDTFGVYGHELKGESQQVANELNSIFTGLLSKQSS